MCNHPELFERNEGSSSFYFGDIANPLLPPPFGELENVYYSGSKNPITYKVITGFVLFKNGILHSN